MAMDDEEAEQALLAGEIDGAFFVASPSAPLVSLLLQAADGVHGSGSWRPSRPTCVR